MIVVADYGMGNLRNVRRALVELGAAVAVTSDPEEIGRAQKLILPGVGAFGEAVKRIDALGLRHPIVNHARSGKPLLGVCLGMQLLFEWSKESSGTKGLGLIKGTVVRFGEDVKVPHIGWNDVVPTGKSELFAEESNVECFYFVHSYFVPDSAATIAHTSYGIRFASAVQTGRIFGVQFHPEKSHAAGMRLLRRFLEIDAGTGVG
jgi:glutamine amidotransferase